MIESITKETIDIYLMSLSESIIKHRIGNTEILLIGGSALALLSNIRYSTRDIDYLQKYSSGLNPCILDVADLYDLPPDWMNMNALFSSSFSDGLFEDAVFYKSFNHILNVYIVSELNLICMKLASERRKDLLDAKRLLQSTQISSEDVYDRYLYLYNREPSELGLKILRK